MLRAAGESGAMPGSKLMSDTEWQLLCFLAGAQKGLTGAALRVKTRTSSRRRARSACCLASAVGRHTALLHQLRLENAPRSTGQIHRVDPIAQKRSSHSCARLDTGCGAGVADL